MVRTTTKYLILICLLLASQVQAQVPNFPSPQAEHEWLKQFTGTWTSTSHTIAAPGEESMVCSGEIKSRLLGGFWVINELQGDAGGGTMHAIQTIGYDPEKKAYVGTWVDSMMNHMWRYEGTVDDSGKKLMLEAEGPNFMAAGKLTKFRDSYEFKSPDLIVATSEMLQENGEWITFMTGEMRRTAPAGE